MKQVVQNLRSGSIAVEEVPPPALRATGVLVATACSLISPGTERAALALGRSSLLGKAVRRPDQVKKVLDTFRREGFWATYNKVQARLDVTRAMGYSCSGVVLESRESDFTAGDRVACVGTDAATHAEINFVPRNLCARIPDNVSFEEAAFVALGGIALHAANLSETKPEENVAVLGLGPVGLLLASCLKANGCHVAAFDLRDDRLHAARQIGMDRTASAELSKLSESLKNWNLQKGFDRVFIAAASRTTEPVLWSVAAARDRGRIIVVGDVRTDFPRNDCYAKELSIVYARSYGAGRYDRNYEELGIEFPPDHVPPTIQSNLKKFLSLLCQGQISVKPLVTHRFPIDQATQAYEVVSGAGPSLGVILQYSQLQKPQSPAMHFRKLSSPNGRIRIGCIGAGSYAMGTLFPLLKSDSKIELVSVATTRGLTAKRAAEQFGFASCTTNSSDVFEEETIDAVVIATQHHAHAALAAAGLENDKACFVEKPLCVSEQQLDQVMETWDENPSPLMIGFNRRFAPATFELASFFKGSGELRSAPLKIKYSINAGELPSGHWLQDVRQGGRILGEACHFVDWCMYVVGVPLTNLRGEFLGHAPNQGMLAELNFVDGSHATIRYDTSGQPSKHKEEIEVSCASKSVHVTDFAAGVLQTGKSSKTLRFRGKGQAEMMKYFLDQIVVKRPLIDLEACVASTRATLKLLESASTGRFVTL